VKAGWGEAVLGDVCQIQSGAGFPLVHQGSSQGDFPFFKVGDMNTEGNEEYLTSSPNHISDKLRKKLGAKILPPASIVFPKVGGAIATNKKRRIKVPSCVDNNIMGLIPITDKIAPNYLAWWLNGIDIYEFSNKANPPSITQATVHNWPIPLPPLEEQQRIVAILDEAFKGLARARTHAETNLQNARELFESKRRTLLTSRDDDWTSKNLNEVCIVERGSSPRPIKAYVTEETDGVHWVKIGDTKPGSKYVVTTKEKITKAGAEKSRAVYKGDFILTNSMTYGRPYIMALDGYIHDGWFALRLKDQIDTDFFFHLLSSTVVQDQFHALAAGSVVKNISGDLVKKTVLLLPPIDLQKQLALQLDYFADEVEHIEEHYSIKLQSLDALRQSLLQKAFAGELTRSPTIVADVATDTLKQSAQILAFAYSRHLSAGNTSTFGHVKAQKVLHLAESILGLELGREPYRDAAGPNDFEHMTRAEVWGKRNDVFEFQQRDDSGYRFLTGTNFDKAIRDAKTNLGENFAALTSLVDLLVPMRTEEAEVFATVHAAWNNLLIDGAAISEEAIVKAAREDWDASKLNIGREKFFAAIKQIRNAGYEPRGTGKYVPAKQASLF
jgi:type I restriction enzyme, S subunit